MRDLMPVTRRQRPDDGTAEEQERSRRRTGPPGRRPVAARPSRLVVGPADDPYEREADRVADLVSGRRSSPSPGFPAATRIRRTTAVGPEGGSLDVDTERSIGAAPGGGTRIRRMTAVGPEGGSVDVETERSIGAARRGGTRIAARDAQLAHDIGADVRQVRLHAGPRAAELNVRLQAAAFTTGHDVFFRDGLPNTSTFAGRHLLAHELAHTVQQPETADARRLIRRELVPAAAAAFNTAEAANPRYAEARTDTDELAAASDQTSLTTTRGWFDWSAETDESRRIADMVRAVVLREYSSRLRALETAKGPQGDPLSTTEKSSKRATYLTMATRFRDKHVPLIAAGATAPETRSFLRGYDLSSEPDDRFATVPGVESRPARIDVRATFIGGELLGYRMRAHLFIVYTGPDGRQMFFRGGPDQAGMTVAHMGDYEPRTDDWDPSAPSVTVLEGPAAQQKLDALQEATLVIDRMRVPYRALVGYDFGQSLPGALLGGTTSLLSRSGENCNATAYTILTRAGIPASKPSGHHPGWGSVLGTWTAGKQNALPPVETMGEPTPYVTDGSRDVTSGSGDHVPFFADRGFFTLIGTLPVKTTVQLLEERPNWRRIQHDDQVGYIPRLEQDAELAASATYMRLLRARCTPDVMQRLIDEPQNDALRAKVSNATGIHGDDLGAFAQLALEPDGAIALQYLRGRLDNLGVARVRELVDDPAEVAWLAAKLGIDPTTVAQQAADLADSETRLTAALLQHLPHPEAASMAVNQTPDFPVVNAIATDLGETFDTIFEQLDLRRPKHCRGEFLHEFLEGDQQLRAAYLPIGRWAEKLGVPQHFVGRHVEATFMPQRSAKVLAQLRPKPLTPTLLAAVANEIESISKKVKGDLDLWGRANDFPDFASLKRLADRWKMDAEEMRAAILEKFRPTEQSQDVLAALGTEAPDTLARFATRQLTPNEVTALLQRLTDLTQLSDKYMVRKITDWHLLQKRA